jgi:flagellar M-ring protein FliF
MAEQEIIPANRAPDASTLLPARSPLSTFTDFSAFTRQPAVRRAIPALVGGGILLMAGAAWWMLQSPAQMPVYAGLNDGDKAAVSEALQGAGIAHDIDRQTGAVTVAEDEVHKARILLAGQGLPKAAPAGDALLDKLPLGASRALEDDKLRGAREADLARTIEAIQAVKSARVMLARPQASPFIRDASPAAASVMLTMENGRALDSAQVLAIRHLVASSVPGLAPASVSVVDQNGSLLSDDSVSGEDKNFQLQLKTEQRLRDAVISLLTPVVGAGNFSTEVHAELDLSESQSTRETFPKDDVGLKSEQGNRTTTSNGSSEAVGIPGAVSNQLPQATQVSATPPATNATTPTQNQSESSETYSRSFDLGREIAVTHQPVGRLRRVTVAVAIKNGKKAMPAAELTQIENLVKGAVGYNAERGDLVAVSARAFVSQPEAVEAIWDKPWFLAALRQAGGVLAALLILLLIGRPILKRMKAKAERDAETEQALLEAVEAADGERPVKGKPITLEMIESAPAYEERAALVRQFVRQDPKRAAMVVQRLLAEPANG